jgi:hypothetical protein
VRSSRNHQCDSQRNVGSHRTNGCGRGSCRARHSQQPSVEHLGAGEASKYTTSFNWTKAASSASDESLELNHAGCHPAADYTSFPCVRSRAPCVRSRWVGGSRPPRSRECSWQQAEQVTRWLRRFDKLSASREADGLRSATVPMTRRATPRASCASRRVSNVTSTTKPTDSSPSHRLPRPPARNARPEPNLVLRRGLGRAGLDLRRAPAQSEAFASGSSSR